LVAALHQGALNITTGEIPVPIGWVEEAVKLASPKGYRIKLQRVDAKYCGQFSSCDALYWTPLPPRSIRSLSCLAAFTEQMNHLAGLFEIHTQTVQRL
jgi:hypothetical protein